MGGPATARDLWRLLEPVHAVVYFAPEAREAYARAGLRGGWMGYFASRSAALGTPSPELVTALFHGFAPGMVARALPDAWRYSTPERVLDARLAVADAALRRLLPSTGADLGDVVELALAAAAAVAVPGRPLAAAHLALPVPDEAHLALWHAATVLREHRGDGHVAALTVAGVDGCEAHVLQHAAGRVPGEQRTYRGWTDEEWEAARGRLRERGWLDAGGALTAEGTARREAIEATTDRLAVAPYALLGDGPSTRLAELLRPVVAAIAAGGGIPYPNAMGVERP